MLGASFSFTCCSSPGKESRGQSQFQPSSRRHNAAMDIMWSFADRLRSKRSLRGLSQSQLGALVGVTRELIKRFEGGKSRPGRALVVRLAAALGLVSEDLLKGTDWRPPERAGRLPGGRFRQRCDWRPQQHCQTASCIKTALDLHRELVTRCLAEIRKRTDHELVRRFLREVSCASYLEAIFLLVLLAAGARPAWVAPLRAGFRHLPVLLRKKQAGDCRHPALELEHEGMRLLVIFQVTLQTATGPIRVDGLVSVALRRRQPRWLVCEVDGPLHVKEKDAERQGRHELLEVRLPYTAFGKQDVLQLFLGETRGKLAIPYPVPEALRVDWKQRRAAEAAKTQET